MNRLISYQGHPERYESALRPCKWSRHKSRYADTPWQTIHHTARCARPGDTVVVHDGTYAEGFGFRRFHTTGCVLLGNDALRLSWRLRFVDRGVEFAFSSRLPFRFAGGF
ncbi:MAG: hypothetical protein ACUVX8_07580 [Candidatus Zipacnadales bacterium]